jgi:hypothetical protein
MRAKEILLGAVAIFAATTAADAQHLSMATLVDEGPVGVWMNHPQYRPFEKAVVSFAAPVGSYLLVLRVGDDGYAVRGSTTVEILYPRTLGTLAVAGPTEALSTTFNVKGGPGTGGKVFAFASMKPFDFSHTRQSFRWNPSDRPINRTGLLESIAAMVVESFGVTAADLFGLSVDQYAVVDRYGAQGTEHKSVYELSSEFYRRCAMRSDEPGCRQPPAF